MHPESAQVVSDYSSGYFKVPSVGAGTANTEFEVLTGMNLRYFGPGEYPYKTFSRTSHVRVLQQHFRTRIRNSCDYTITEVISTAVPRYLIIWDLTVLQVKSL